MNNILRIVKLLSNKVVTSALKGTGRWPVIWAWKGGPPWWLSNRRCASQQHTWQSCIDGHPYVVRSHSEALRFRSSMDDIPADSVRSIRRTFVTGQRA